MIEAMIILAAIAFKTLLFFSYHSTDFEVHRNWLAVTYSTPLSQWYEEATSHWTLDYPPLFAAVEWFLAQFASYIDPRMLILSKDPYVSSSVIIFQRCSVIFMELLLIYAVHSLLLSLLGPTTRGNRALRSVAMALFAFNFGLFIVDRILL
ncbi:unnamed protein product [Dibothriocephalus latus]|uniref:Alpha-1,3-glucosyltransferase n=1 Tax=Dibothriocephalus latus TaxID=60516 RepID=A0A3P7LHM2_DIBLA|nr:unnamed protein product [Dibothriocephalus latus]